MDFPIIDQDFSRDVLQLREATEPEKGEIKSKPPRDHVYWVKARDGRILRGINRKGLDDLLTELDWLEKQEALKLAGDIASLFVALKPDEIVQVSRQDARLEFFAQRRHRTGTDVKRSPYAEVISSFLEGRPSSEPLVRSRAELTPKP